MKYILSTLIALVSTVLIFGHQVEAKTIDSGELIKASSQAVYYYFDGKRYVFPNEDVFYSWYQNFDNVNVVSDETLASLPIGGNVTYRPGTRLVKIVSDPKVYAVLENNKLQWLAGEELAAAYYGEGWAQNVRDVSDALFLDYATSEDSLEMIPPNAKEIVETAKTTHPDYAKILKTFAKDKVSSSIDDFLHPDLLEVIELKQYGYMASSTYTLVELEQFFKNNSTDWTLQTDYFHGFASGTARLINFSKLVGDSFAHRSIIITDEADSDRVELVFNEIIYPSGYISYPGGVTIEYVKGNENVNHTFISTVSMNEVQNWYSAVGATLGWTNLELEEDVLDGIHYEKMEHKGLARMLQHLYIEGSYIPEFNGLTFVRGDFNKTIQQ
jgi:hypothetical protein